MKIPFHKILVCLISAALSVLCAGPTSRACAASMGRARAKAPTRFSLSAFKAAAGRNIYSFNGVYFRASLKGAKLSLVPLKTSEIQRLKLKPMETSPSPTARRRMGSPGLESRKSLRRIAAASEKYGADGARPEDSRQKSAEDFDGFAARYDSAVRFRITSVKRPDPFENSGFKTGTAVQDGPGEDRDTFIRRYDSAVRHRVTSPQRPPPQSSGDPDAPEARRPGILRNGPNFSDVDLTH
ncbi:MAG: hypothetical protein A3G41_07225 [Elusimicrobia bacterium RIFCSPLOWO2_12_FULL_59_9]|nr:MAG: hypothetical protein A3G41_07225 [Elusimicrobia bacterium RIFCSPLOWO2_12_FULL_59_9]